MEEQNLGLTGIIDQSNVAQVGKVEGLDYMVLGTIVGASATDNDNSYTYKGTTTKSFSTTVKLQPLSRNCSDKKPKEDSL
jgi:hypothetical protein